MLRTELRGGTRGRTLVHPSHPCDQARWGAFHRLSVAGRRALHRVGETRVCLSLRFSRVPRNHAGSIVDTRECFGHCDWDPTGNCARSPGDTETRFQGVFKAIHKECCSNVPSLARFVADSSAEVLRNLTDEQRAQFGRSRRSAIDADMPAHCVRPAIRGR